MKKNSSNHQIDPSTSFQVHVFSIYSIFQMDSLANTTIPYYYIKRFLYLCWIHILLHMIHFRFECCGRIFRRCFFGWSWFSMERWIRLQVEPVARSYRWRISEANLLIDLLKSQMSCGRDTCGLKVQVSLTSSSSLLFFSCSNSFSFSFVFEGYVNLFEKKYLIQSCCYWNMIFGFSHYFFTLWIDLCTWINWKSVGTWFKSMLIERSFFLFFFHLFFNDSWLLWFLPFHWSIEEGTLFR